MKTTANTTETEQPRMRIAADAYRQIHLAITAKHPETGGILLGPIGSTEITDFHFDVTGSCTPASYSPDHITLNKLMKEQWMPSGIDMKGFVHSHPPGTEALSIGDLRYIRRLLTSNTDMDIFAAPIVLPDKFLFHPYIVRRENMKQPVLAQLELF